MITVVACEPSFDGDNRILSMFRVTGDTNLVILPYRPEYILSINNSYTDAYALANTQVANTTVLVCPFCNTLLHESHDGNYCYNINCFVKTYSSRDRFIDRLDVRCNYNGDTTLTHILAYPSILRYEIISKLYIVSLSELLEALGLDALTALRLNEQLCYETGLSFLIDINRALAMDQGITSFSNITTPEVAKLLSLIYSNKRFLIELYSLLSLHEHTHAVV